jgi:HEAT repeat protein
MVRDLRSDMPFVAAAGARALGESGRPDAAAPLVSALAREQRSVRFAAVEALLALGQGSAGALREARERERDPEVRGLMDRVLGQPGRAAIGPSTLPASNLLQMSPEMVEQMTKDLGR